METMIGMTLLLLALAVFAMRYARLCTFLPRGIGPLPERACLAPRLAARHGDF